MDSDKDIRINDLRKIINSIFDHIEHELEINSIELKHDYYYDINLDDVFNFSEEEPNIGAGQLYDDWDFLERLLENKEERVSMMFDHVAPILRYLAYRIGK